MKKPKEIKQTGVRVIMDKPPEGEMPTDEQFVAFLKTLLGDDYDPEKDESYQESKRARASKEEKPG